MNRRKSFAALTMVLILVLTMLAGCTSPGASTSAAPASAAATAAATPAEVYTIKIATAYQDGHYMVKGYEAFKQYVEKESGGRISVELFANGTVVNGDRDSCEYVSTNSIQMGNSDYTMIGTFVDDLRWQSTSIPYYYGTDPEDVYKILDNSIAWETCYSELEKSGIHILGCVNGGAATIINDEHDITSMADFIGLRVRTPESDPYVQPIKLFGANATPMSFSEIYTSVQQGVIDGVFTSKSAIVQYSFGEICKHQLDCNVFLLIFGFMMNADFYNSLPADLQSVVDKGGEVLDEAAREGEIEFRASLNDQLEALDVTVTEPDETFVADLKAAVEPYVQTRREAIPEFIEQLDKDIAQILG